MECSKSIWSGTVVAVSRYLVRERPFERVQNRDAYAVGLVVERDGQRLGLWTAMVSGVAMRNDPADTAERYWAALAVVGARHAEASINEKRPAGWQLDAHRLTVDASDVQRLAESGEDLPSGPSEDPVLMFEAQ